jgi:glycosyltransferase involved in cell wall biosynthesis
MNIAAVPGQAPAPLTVLQLLPELQVGGVEQGTIEIASALVRAGHRALVVSAGGRMVPALEATGAHHVAMSIGRKRLPTLLLARRLRELCEREGVDIVHARSRLPAWIGHLALRGIPAERRPRWVTTVHGPYTVNRYSRIMVSGERVIAISEFIHHYIRRGYPDVDPGRITVIPRGVDRLRYPRDYAPPPAWRDEWQQSHPELARRQALVLPGRLTRWKGQEDFIRLVAKLVGRGLPVHGLLAGGAHPRKRAFERELHKLVAELEIEPAVSFLGNRGDLREILSVSACAFSLTGEPEAFGRTTIEALSLGVPVIGYDHGGTGEILRSIFPAGVVPVGDIDAAAERCAAFLQQRPPLPVIHPYTVERMQTATLAVYAELAASSRQRA